MEDWETDKSRKGLKICHDNITESMVREEISNLELTKSSGFTEINTRCLKICLISCAKEFTMLLNKCIVSSTFPSTWKEAIVVLYLKTMQFQRNRQY